jgi:hypothetical protein
MDESRLRELVQELHAELPDLVADDQEQRQIAAEIEAALAEPEGAARTALLAVLRARRETRAWAEARTGAQEVDVVRVIPGPAGGATAPTGVHFVCPNPIHDFDRILNSPTDDPGYCPYDGLKLVRAPD